MITKEEVDLKDKDLKLVLEKMTALRGSVIPHKDRIIGFYVPIIKNPKIMLDLTGTRNKLDTGIFASHPGIFVVLVVNETYQNQSGITIQHNISPEDVLYIKLPRVNEKAKTAPELPAEPLIFDGAIFDIVREFDVQGKMTEFEKKNLFNIINFHKYKAE